MTNLERARNIGVSAPSTAEPRRILAIDYGRKRIGLALSDELGVTAQPLITITRTNRRNDLRRLREICRKHSVARILVGHPLHMTGDASPMAEEAALFAARLHEETLGIEVELVDERLTTWEAAQTMAEVNSWSRRRRARSTTSPRLFSWWLPGTQAPIQKSGRSLPPVPMSGEA